MQPEFCEPPAEAKPGASCGNSRDELYENAAASEKVMFGLATNRCCRTAGDEQPVNQTAMRLSPANKRFRRAAALFRIVGLVAMLCTYKRTDEAVYSLQK